MAPTLSAGRRWVNREKQKGVRHVLRDTVYEYTLMCGGEWRVCVV